MLNSASLTIGEPDAGSLPYHVIARWLARLHTASSSLDGSALFPDRGPSHYLAHLHAGRERLSRGQAQRQMSPDEQAVLDDRRGPCGAPPRVTRWPTAGCA